MRNTFIFFLLILITIGTPVLGQNGAKKIYVAQVNNSDTTITKRDRDEITFQAKTTINNLKELLELVTSTIPSEAELDKAIKDSYLPNSNQLFYNDAIVIEDDIDPKHTSSTNTADLPVDRYLKNLAIYYSKSDTSTIKFSPALITTLIEGKSYPYIKAFFTSTFSGKYIDPQNSQSDSYYQTVQRVAELRVQKIDGKWRTYIVRLGFLQPGEGLTSETKSVVVTTTGPAKPIASKLVLYRSSNTGKDSVTVKWDNRWLNVVRSTTEQVPVGFYQYRKIDNTSQAFVSITLSNSDQNLAFRAPNGSISTFSKIAPTRRLTALLQIIAGTAALGASYAGYSWLQRNYNDYTSQLTSLNAEYAIWKTLSQQPGESPAASMPFNNYAQPGIYAVYGGGIVGSGLVLNGIRQLLKASKHRSVR
ncbi:hypothetical protein HNV11_16070 [Spirosoma taeanense]|uniref:Uncharacterized protein n=1 Tax=Spirosoma taeanense TaxID=2735870 RepID=A0A6M5YBU6_9BACT|nr:hypothetical protein [Spirosoma taeanense]QJW90786.1 hypothetical protein HNV11_16070 [Spirosoma taeanense]